MKEHPVRSGRALVKSGSILSLLTLGSRMLGLVREMVKAALLGTSALSDAFTVAFMIPNLLRRLFAEGSIAVAFIPTLKDYQLHEDKESTKEFLSATFTMLSFSVSVVVVLGIIASPLIIPLFGMSEFSETVFLTRVMFPYLAVISIAALFQGMLNSVHIFAPTGIAPILFNICVIGCSLGLSRFTVNPARAMAIGVILGGTVEALIQLPFVLKQGFRFTFIGLKKAFTNKGTRTILRLIGPTIIGMAAYQLNDLVSTALAGNAGPGVVSSLQFSLRLKELILGIFAVSIGTVLLPDLASHAKSGRWADYERRLVQAIKIISLLTIPITFFSLIYGEQMIRFLFQTRSFNEDSVRLTTLAFSFHIPGLLFIALNRIIAPAFYARSDTRSPTIAGVISFIVNMILAAILVKPMKGGGVALALSIASLVNTILLFVFLGKAKEFKISKAVTESSFYALKMLIFSLIASIPAMFIKKLLSENAAGANRFLAYGLPLIIGTVVFAATGILLLGISKDSILRSLASKLRRTKR